MVNFTTTCKAWMVLLALCLTLQPALAGQLYNDEVPIDASVTLDVLDLGETASTRELSEISGRQDIDIDEVDIQVSNLQQDAKLSWNVISKSTTGLNALSGEAFSNAQGISTVIQNSGNQVIINNALILNLNVE